jgi:hypothetical protein
MSARLNRDVQSGGRCDMVTPMFPLVDTKDASAVRVEVQSIYRSLFPQGDANFVSRAFEWALDCFRGKYANYQPIDARYHDLEHTMQGTLCFARILNGYQERNVQPRFSEKMVQLGLFAILLHDTGYLKTRDDREGTGAKYTLTHVNRSCEFAQMLLTEKGYPAEEIRAVQNMIRCTGVNVDLSKIPFQNTEERVLGFALGTADLLGQMAAEDYVDKLAILFTEFEESARFNDGKFTGAGAFSSVQDLRSKTPMFWEKYVLPKITRDFQGLYRYLGRNVTEDDNFYVSRIRSNLTRLQQELKSA